MRSALLVALVACKGSAPPGRVAIDTADALWGDHDAVCARTARGLSCWTTPEQPVLVAGLDHVTQVAIVRGEACALHDGDVTCFAPGSADSRQRSFDQPTALASVDGSLCVVHATGTSCWTAGGVPAIRDVAVTPAMGGARAGRCELRAADVICTSE